MQKTLLLCVFLSLSLYVVLFADCAAAKHITMSFVTVQLHRSSVPCGYSWFWLRLLEPLFIFLVLFFSHLIYFSLFHIHVLVLWPCAATTTQIFPPGINNSIWLKQTAGVRKTRALRNTSKWSHLKAAWKALCHSFLLLAGPHRHPHISPTPPHFFVCVRLLQSWRNELYNWG